MKLTLGLSLKKADKIIQLSDSELPNLNIYLADERGVQIYRLVGQLLYFGDIN